MLLCAPGRPHIYRVDSFLPIVLKIYIHEGHLSGMIGMMAFMYIIISPLKVETCY